MGRLTLICGLQGTGKTTVGRILAEVQSAKLLGTDIIRKDLFQNSQYTSEEMQVVYEEIFLQARHRLEQGEDVILDATFSKMQNRARAQKIADQLNIDFLVIEVTCSDENMIKERLRNRAIDASEADWEVYLQAKKEFESITRPHLTIDNSGTPEELKSKFTEQ